MGYYQPYPKWERGNNSPWIRSSIRKKSSQKISVLKIEKVQIYKGRVKKKTSWDCVRVTAQIEFKLS